MGRDEKLVMEASTKDLFDELEARFPSGVIMGVVRQNQKFVIHASGQLGALDQLNQHVAKLISSKKEKDANGNDH